MDRDHRALIDKVIKKYGATINLNTHPETLIEILRSIGRIFEDPDGGAPGGVGSPPPCIVEGGRITEEDLMKAILRLTRDVAAIKTSIGVRGK